MNRIDGADVSFYITMVLIVLGIGLLGYLHDNQQTQLQLKCSEMHGSWNAKDKSCGFK